MTGKKKGRSKEKKTGETSEKLAAVDKSFYEIIITDLNNKLARLRSSNSKLEESNEELNEKLQKIQEDRTDTTAYLNRKLAEKEDVIKDLSEQLVELSKVREQETREATDKIKEWEQRYKAIQEQLSSEIKLLNGKLSSLEEFRVQKDELLAKFYRQESLLKNEQSMHKSVIAEMERKVIIDKEQLKKDVHNRLFKLSSTFNKSGETRMAIYTQRLIHENIALNNEMNKMLATQNKMDENYRNFIRRSEEIHRQHIMNEDIKQRLVYNLRNQLKIIGTLTSELETLKSKYGKSRQYKKLYEDTVKRDTCERFKLSDMEKKLTVMKQKLDTLKNEKTKLIYLHQASEAEMLRLQNIIKHIKFTVDSGIRNEKESFYHKFRHKVLRGSFLTEIVQIITTNCDEMVVPSISTVSNSSTMYRSGSVGLMPRSASLLQIFRREARRLAATDAVSHKYNICKPDTKVTPSTRKLDSQTLFDAQSGTKYVTTTTGENAEDPVELSE